MSGEPVEKSIRHVDVQNNPYLYDGFCSDRRSAFRNGRPFYSNPSGCSVKVKSKSKMRSTFSTFEVSEYVVSSDLNSVDVHDDDVVQTTSTVKENSSSVSNRLRHVFSFQNGLRRRMTVEEPSSRYCVRNQVRRNGICNPFHIPLNKELQTRYQQQDGKTPWPPASQNAGSSNAL